jgi:hypothetical protein
MKIIIKRMMGDQWLLSIEGNSATTSMNCPQIDFKKSFSSQEEANNFAEAMQEGYILAKQEVNCNLERILFPELCINIGK